jgi:hypothetical protein
MENTDMTYIICGYAFLVFNVGGFLILNWLVNRPMPDSTRTPKEQKK